MNEKNREQEAFVSQMLTRISAQMRGALGNIQGALENIVPPQVRDKNIFLDQNAAILYQSYFRMVRLAGNLSDAAELDEPLLLPLSNGDIVAVIREICHAAEGVAALKEQRLTFSSTEEEHTAAFHTDSLERVLLNLLSNAMKFTPKGGAIRVELRFDGNITLLVSDTGSGIDPVLLPTLFDAQLDSAQENSIFGGLGLGLPICRRLISGQDGTIEVLRTDKSGTCMKVTLPDHLSTVVRVQDVCFDRTGGFDHTLVELSDALPARAFLKEYMD